MAEQKLYRLLSGFVKFQCDVGSAVIPPIYISNTDYNNIISSIVDISDSGSGGGGGGNTGSVVWGNSPLFFSGITAPTLQTINGRTFTYNSSTGYYSSDDPSSTGTYYYMTGSSVSAVIRESSNTGTIVMKNTTSDLSSGWTDAYDDIRACTVSKTPAGWGNNLMGSGWTNADFAYFDGGPWIYNSAEDCYRISGRSGVILFQYDAATGATIASGNGGNGGFIISSSDTKTVAVPYAFTTGNPLLTSSKAIWRQTVNFVVSGVQIVPV